MNQQPDPVASLVLVPDLTPEQVKAARRLKQNENARRYHHRHREEVLKKMRVYHARYRKENAEVYRKRSREYYHKNREKRQAYRKERVAQDSDYRVKCARKEKYGLTHEAFLALIDVQSDKCAICRTRFDHSVKWGGAHVDHDHANGRVRGLLCRNCNTGIGDFRDNPEILLLAYEYLKRQEG